MVSINLIKQMFLGLVILATSASQGLGDESDGIVSISGRAVDKSGAPLKGEVDIELRFFDGEHSSAELQLVKRKVLMNEGGVFSLNLTEADLAQLDYGSCWFELKIADFKSLPRQRLSSHLFAQNARFAKGAKKEFTIQNDAGESIRISAPDRIEENLSLVLPGSFGTSGQVLSTDGNGVLSWSDPAKAEGGGSQSSNINGANIGSGTGVFSGKNGDNLEFKSLKAGNGLKISSTNDQITFESDLDMAQYMAKSVYDMGGVNGVVDNSERLGGFNADYFLNASNLNTGVISESMIDASIARDNEITYKSPVDLRNALDSVYSAQGHSHLAAQIADDPLHRFVSDGERLEWATSSQTVSNASESAAANQLVKRDSSAGASFNKVEAKAVHLNSSNASVKLEASSNMVAGSTYSIRLPERQGSDGEYLESDGQGNLNWKSKEPGALSIRDQIRGLQMQNTVGNPNQSVSITADEALLVNATGRGMLVKGISLSNSIANALDTGSPQNDRWYHVWLVNVGQNATLIYSLSSSYPSVAPNSYVAYVGAIYRKSDGNFIRIKQRGTKVIRESIAIVQAGFETAYTAMNLSAAVPSKAIAVSGELGLNQDYSVYAQGIYVSTEADGFGEIRFISYNEGGLTDEISWGFNSTLSDPQNLYYRCYHKLGDAYCSSARANVFVKINGWEF